jgi:hypothetical protein
MSWGVEIHIDLVWRRDNSCYDVKLSRNAFAYVKAKIKIYKRCEIIIGYTVKTPAWVNGGVACEFPRSSSNNLMTLRLRAYQWWWR